MPKVMKKPSACFPAPKKGKARLVMKNVNKKKHPGWYTRVPYVRHGIKSHKARNDRVKWSCSLKKLLTIGDTEIVRMLKKDGFLKEWSGATCPHCNKASIKLKWYWQGFRS